MKTYILTVDEGYGEYVYAVFANSLEEAYKKIKDDEDLSFSNFRDYKNKQKHISFVADGDVCSYCCALQELQESDEIVRLGGYAE